MEANPEIVDNNVGVADNNIWKIIANVFTSPAEAFSQFRIRPKILILIVLTFVLAALVAGLTTQYQAEMQFDLIKKSTIIPPQQLEQMKEQATDASPLQGIIFGGAMVLIFGILGTLVAWFIGSFIMGGQARFKAMWGATMLGGLIALFGGLVRLPLIYAKGSAYVSIGLAAFFPGKDFTSIFYSLLYYFDAFAIWSIIVTGIGYGVILGITRGKGIAVAFISYALFTVIAISLSAFGLSISGVEISFF